MWAGVQLADSFAQGVSQYEAGRARSNLYGMNAQIASAQAQSEESAGAYGELLVRMRGEALRGQQVAQIGASNLQQAGTSQQVVADTARMNELDALQTRNNALRRAWGFEVQGVSDQYQATLARQSGINQGIGSILSGGGKAINTYNETGSFF